MSNCIICGTENKTGFLCKEHYKEVIAEKEKIDKNQSKNDLKIYYFNLKNFIWKILDIETCNSLCCRLIAIAELYRDIYTDDALTQRVYTDVQKLISDKKEYIKKRQKQKDIEADKKFNDKDFREKLGPGEIRTKDGHMVRSYAEQTIDDFLYMNNIVHAYEKIYTPLNHPEAVLIPDFYIPEINAYIEYWGNIDQKYAERRQIKEIYYKEDKTLLISLEKEDIEREELLQRKMIKAGLKRQWR